MQFEMPPGPNLPPDFGARIRAARAYRDDISRDELGRRLGVSGGYIKNLENGKRPDPLKARALLDALPEATGLPRTFFLGRDPEEPTLASIQDLLEAMRVENAANALEVIRRLDEGLPPNAATR